MGLTFEDYFFPAVAVIGIIAVFSLVSYGMTIDALWEAGRLSLWGLSGYIISRPLRLLKKHR